MLLQKELEMGRKRTLDLGNLLERIRIQTNREHGNRTNSHQ
jgi:hypothetical protein